MCKTKPISRGLPQHLYFHPCRRIRTCAPAAAESKTNRMPQARPRWVNSGNPTQTIRMPSDVSRECAKQSQLAQDEDLRSRPSPKTTDPFADIQDANMQNKPNINLGNPARAIRMSLNAHPECAKQSQLAQDENSRSRPSPKTTDPFTGIQDPNMQNEPNINLDNPAGAIRMPSDVRPECAKQSQCHNRLSTSYARSDNPESNSDKTNPIGSPLRSSVPAPRKERRQPVSLLAAVPPDLTLDTPVNFWYCERSWPAVRVHAANVDCRGKRQGGWVF